MLLVPSRALAYEAACALAEKRPIPYCWCGGREVAHALDAKYRPRPGARVCVCTEDSLPRSRMKVETLVLNEAGQISGGFSSAYDCTFPPFDGSRYGW